MIIDHPNGKINDSYLVNGDLYVWSDTENDWINVGNIRGPAGPQGEVGPTGPTGPSLMRSAYLVTFNGGQSAEGIPVNPDDRLPIDREELDISGLVTLDTDDEVIQFDVTGYYKITFTVSAHIISNELDFDPENDFIALGFRLVGTGNIFIGVSEWVYDDENIQLVAQGIIAVENVSNAYELVNLSKNTIYLNTPELKNIGAVSYFANSLVTIVIEYLGRQGA